MTEIEPKVYNVDVTLPAHIKIGGTKHIITRTPMADQGNILFLRGKILINDELCQEKAEEAVCHEIVEGWNDLYNLKLKHRKIQIIGNALHQLLKDNDLSSMSGAE